MNRVKRFFSEHRYMFGFFFIILIAQYIGCRDKFYILNELSYSFHVIDYRIGFVSRILPGQIFLLIFKNPTRSKMMIFESILLVLTVLVSSFFLEKVYLSAKEENRYSYFYIILLFCISGSTFCIFYENIGMLDVYCIYTFLLFLIVLQNKHTMFLIPILYVAMTAIHFWPFLDYIPLMSIILLYKAAISDDKKEKKRLIVILAVSIFFAVAFAAIFLYNEKNNLRYTIDEFHRYLDARGIQDYSYFDYSFYNNAEGVIWGKSFQTKDYTEITAVWIPSFIRRIINRIIWQICNVLAMYKIGNRNILGLLSTMFLAAIPILSLIYYSYVKFFKLQNNRLKKFCIICGMAIFPFSFFSSVLLSTDIVRWFSHAFTCHLVFFLYILYKQKHLIGDYIRSFLLKIKKSYLFLYPVLVLITRYYPYA